MDYERLPHGPIESRLTAGAGIVSFRALNVRRERNVRRATVAIGDGVVVYEQDDIRLDRREERNRLATAAYARMRNANGYEKEDLQAHLLDFVTGLWDEHVRGQRAAATRGDTQPSEPPWLIEDYVVGAAGHVLFAHPGRGKSWTALLLATCLDAGLQGVWEVPSPERVLYVNLERSESSMARRLGQVNGALGLDRDRGLLMLHRRGRSLSDVIDAVHQAVVEHKVKLVVVDSLSRTGVGDLTENQTANNAMDLLNGLGAAWLALGHTPRSDETHLYGSVMFDAAADIAIQLLTEEQDGPTPQLGIGMKVTKSNDTAKPPLRIWAYEFDRRYGISRVREAEAFEFPVIEDDGSGAKGAASANTARVAAYLLQGPAHISRIAEELMMSKSSVSRALDELSVHSRVELLPDRGPHGAKLFRSTERP